MQWGSLPCISDHEMCTQRVAASGLQGKDHKSPLFQTSLSPHEAEGGKQKTFSIKQPHKYLLATIPCGTMKHKLVKGIWEGGSSININLYIRFTYVTDSFNLFARCKTSRKFANTANILIIQYHL